MSDPVLFQSLIKSINGGDDIELRSICDKLTKRELRRIKTLLANKVCEEVWDKYMGPFERALDKAFTEIILEL